MEFSLVFFSEYFCMLCLIVVPLPSGKNTFADQLNNNNNNNKYILAIEKSS
jgi:hypothetical protein